VEQAPGEDRGGGEEQADGLIAMEGFALGVAAGVALLQDGVILKLVVHACALGLWPSGSITERFTRGRDRHGGCFPSVCSSLQDRRNSGLPLALARLARIGCYLALSRMSACERWPYV